MVTTADCCHLWSHVVDSHTHDVPLAKWSPLCQWNIVVGGSCGRRQSAQVMESLFTCLAPLWTDPPPLAGQQWDFREGRDKTVLCVVHRNNRTCFARHRNHPLSFATDRAASSDWLSSTAGNGLRHHTTVPDSSRRLHKSWCVHPQLAMCSTLDLHPLSAPTHCVHTSNC